MEENQRRNVLIVAYEFPPSAGGGVQRLAKMVRYLPDSGWTPHVLAATPVWGRPQDESLVEQVAFAEVTRLPNRSIGASVARALAPVKALRRRGGGSSAGAGVPAKPAAAAGATGIPASTRIVRRLGIDTAELWARKVPAEALRLHRKIGFDAVIASGPPHSALVAGARAAREMGVPFIADFRDAWRENPDFRRPESPDQDARSLALEREVLSVADAVVAVSQPIADETLEEGATTAIVVPNGFDPSDLPRHRVQRGPLTIAFMGRFYGSTDPTPFFDGAAEAVRRGGPAADLHIEVLGQMSDFVRDAIESRGLDGHVTYHGYLPHAQALEIVSRSDAGLVALRDHAGGEANYTGKIFEYLGVGLPILLVGPEMGVAAQLVREARAGIAVPYSRPDRVADALEELARRKVDGFSVVDPVAEVVARFDRRTQAARIAALLDEVVSARA